MNTKIIFKGYIVQVILLFGFSIFLAFSPLQAAVQTNTHTYILSKSENAVLVIDRKTGQEQKINVDSSPRQMVIYDDFGYLLTNFYCGQYSKYVTVIGLKDHKIIKRITVGEHPTHMVIHKGLGYVCNAKSDSVSVIDLKSHCLINTIPVGHWPTQIVFHEGLGYVTHLGPHSIISIFNPEEHYFKKSIPGGTWTKKTIFHEGFGYTTCVDSKNLLIFDLKTHTVVPIKVGARPIPIVIHNGFGYVTNTHNSTVSVIDLKAQTVVKTISVGTWPKKIVIHKGHGYVSNSYNNTVSVIDLKTHNVIHKISVKGCDKKIIIHEGLGYTMMDTYSCVVSVIDLKTQKVIKEIENPKKLKVDFSDTHVYLGVNKACPLPRPALKLFDHPYTGIESPLFYEDEEQAFEQFESAVLTKDYKAAQIHFNKALATGHKKAYAVAFKAFCNGYWGASQNDEWAKEFSLNVDFKYLNRIDDDPYEFTLSQQDEDISKDSSH